MSALAALLRALVVDPRSQRAIEETIVDGREEIAGAATPTARGVACLRAGVGTLRVLSGSFGRECRQVEWLAVLIVMLSLSIVPILVAALTAWPVLSTQRSPVAVTAMVGLLSVGAVAAFAPISAFVGGLFAGRRRMSPLPLIALLVLQEFALVGWLTPEANQLFRQSVYEWSTPDRPLGAELTRGAAERSIGQLLRPANALEARQAKTQLRTRTTLLLLTGWLAIVGFALSRRSLPSLAAWVTVLVVLFVASYLSRNLSLLGYGLTAWLLAVTIAAFRSNRPGRPTS